MIVVNYPTQKINTPLKRGKPLEWSRVPTSFNINFGVKFVIPCEPLCASIIPMPPSCFGRCFSNNSNLPYYIGNVTQHQVIDYLSHLAHSHTYNVWPNILIVLHSSQFVFCHREQRRPEVFYHSELQLEFTIQ